MLGVEDLATAPPLTIEPYVQQPWSERILWTLVGIAILNLAIGLYGQASAFPWVGGIVVFSGAWGLGTVTLSLMQFGQSRQVRRYADRLGWITALVLVAIFVVWGFTQVHGSPAYGTDELAFDQYAGQLFQHGVNPYTHTMHPAFGLFRVSPDGATFKLTGAKVTQFSYPSLAFLVYVPFLILGWSHELGVGLNVIAWAASILLMFGLLPRNMRAAALVIGLADVYISYAVGGVTDALYMPLLIVAAYQWDRFGEDRRSYIGPVMVGLAMAVKQTPWPLLLFIVAGLACDEYARSGMEAALRRAGRYVRIVVIAFLIPNVPFIVVSPAAWVRGTLTPLFANMVPSGQGTVALTLFLHLGGGSLFAFTVATAFMAVLLLVSYVGTYPLMRPATFVLPALFYFFASRSQTNYLVSLIPVAIVAAVTVRPLSRRVESHELDGVLLDASLPGRGWSYWVERVIGPAGPFRSRRWAKAAIGVAALFVLAVIYSLTASPPFKLKVVGVQIVGLDNVAEQIEVRAQNTTGSRQKPVFTVMDPHGVTAPWQAHGPRTLAPGQTAVYRLVTPNATAEPSVAGGFSVLAFVAKPGSVSVSNRELPALMHLALSPQSFDTPIAVGKTITLRVQLVRRLNQTARKAGVAVYLTQTVFGGRTVKGRAAAIINDHTPGAGNVVAYTNAQGIATFQITGTRAYELPTTFTAKLADLPAHYTYGSSGGLTISFVNR